MGLGKTLLLSILLTASSAFAGIHQTSDGMPAPWPFPWAKECPINWKSLEGSYILAESHNFIEIEIQVKKTFHGLRLVRMSRYDDAGRLLSYGSTYVGSHNSALRVELHPMITSENRIRATLKFHFSSDLGPFCYEWNLVPILTMESFGSTVEKNDYRLLRLQSQ
ncbi:MAG: hypothetical protein AB7F86_00690 [Bdellovibrionales bacterium]